MIVSSDSDFCMCVRSGVLMLKDFKCDARKNLTCDITLSFSDETLSSKMHADLKIVRNDEAKLTATDFQFIANHESLESRALTSLCMGSDAHEGGIKGMGVSKINHILSKFPNQGKK